MNIVRFFKSFAVFMCAILAASSLPCIAEDTSASSYEDLFAKDHVMQIYIDIGGEDWQNILANPTAEEYHSANITVDGNKVENIGIRTKGNSSLNSVAGSDSDRYSFRIKFGKYVGKQKLLGLDEMVLNNCMSDPSYLREYLSYEALRSIGSPVPEAAFAQVYINGELFGFYLCVEAIDNTFLKSNFGDDNGNLYKQGQGSSLMYQEGSDYASCELNKGKDTEKTGLKNLIQTLNAMPDGQKGDIESVLNVDSALQYIAANTVLGSYDSYSGSMQQNYYLYEQGGMFTVIPWDYNMSMGGFMGTFSTGQTIPIDEPVHSINMERAPLIRKLLQVTEYKEKYHEYIRQMLDYLENFESRVTELADLIRPYVDADPTKFYTMEQFENNVIYQENNTDEGFPGGMAGGGFPGGQIPGEGQEMPGQMPGGGQMQPPDGQTMPDGSQRPEGEFPGQGRPGGGGGGMISANTGSIVTFIVNRMENIKKQLSGELPTTGNTTMNQGGGMGRPEGGQGRPGGNNRPITVLLGNTPVSFDQPPVIEDGRTLVPLRAIFEALGATVDWDEATQTITAQKDGTIITLVIGQTTAYKNNSAVTLDVGPKIIGGRTLVPVRFIAESFDLNVQWEEAARTVRITS